ncbi:MAG: PQQ-binding-like beta-propeller repeat protein [Candidatus Bathyarchaeia archaeon]
MANSKIKVFSMMALFLMLSIVIPSTVLSTANAHTPAWQIPQYAFCNVAPNPAGIGQSVNVGFWIGQAPPTAGTIYGDRWTGMTVKVTLPDKTTKTLGPFTSDDTGGTHTEFTPTELGNYTFQMFYAGQTLAGANPPPAGFSAATKPYIGDYYEPATSNVATLVVQQEATPSASQAPLPATYWTRPIESVNDLWYSISGNWLGLGTLFSATTGMYNATGNYNPYTTAPTTAHLLWTKPESFGGQIGGEFGGTDTSNYYSTRQYERMFQPIIIQGILYFEQYTGSINNPTGWLAVDLQTGQTIWTDNSANLGGGSPAQSALTSAGIVTSLRCGQTLDYTTPNQYGATAYLWSTGTPVGIVAQAGTTTWNMFDAVTGQYILSVVNGTGMNTLIEDNGGNLVGYFVNSTVGTQMIQGEPVTNPSGGALLECWNSTQCIVDGTNGPAAWMWRPTQNGQISFPLGVMWGQPLATNINGVPLPLSSVAALPSSATLSLNSGTYTTGGASANSGVLFLSSIASAGGSSYNAGFIIEAGYSQSTGQQLWIVNRTETPYTRVDFSQTSNGIFVEINQDTAAYTGYSIITGKQLWGPFTLPNPDAYNSIGSYYGQVVNGMMYLSSFGGDIYAINMSTGSIIWQTDTNTISGPAGSDTPYGVWPIWQFGNPGAIADGILFLGEGHEYSPPLFRGADLIAVNLTNGQPVWSILNFDVDGGSAISDGVLLSLSAYDNQIYAYGMGPSETTVNAPSVGVTTATPITITGSVMDISAGSKQEAVAANFPHGLPCVSDASMTQFMEAVYEQQPMPSNVTGVLVTFYVLDSNNNYRSIGSTTTNSLGDYSFTWKPDITGSFTLYATFAGTQSYYGSSASTAFYASASAPTQAPTTTPLSGLASNSTLEYGLVAIIVVIVIIGAVLALLVTRKHP